jgi:hypothetical protein
MAVIASDRAREQRARDIENSLASGGLAVVLRGLSPPPKQWPFSSVTLMASRRWNKWEPLSMSTPTRNMDREYGPVRLPRKERS